MGESESSIAEVEIPIHNISLEQAVRGIFRAIRSMMEDLRYRTNLIAPCIMDTPASSYFAEMCRARGIPVGDVGNVVDDIVRCAADESINDSNTQLYTILLADENQQDAHRQLARRRVSI